MHDPTAVIALTDPGLFRTRQTPLAVALDGEAMGRTRPALDAATRPATVCTGGDTVAIRQRFLDVVARAG